jgi:hypothetical protein
VLRSYADWTSCDGIPRDEFALGLKAAAETSLYEADFVLADGVRWTYGFELGQRRVEAEWLCASPKGRRQVWFGRDAALLRTQETAALDADPADDDVRTGAEGP